MSQDPLQADVVQAVREEGSREGVAQHVWRTTDRSPALGDVLGDETFYAEAMGLFSATLDGHQPASLRIFAMTAARLAVVGCSSRCGAPGCRGVQR